MTHAVLIPFQSTHPRGVRPVSPAKTVPAAKFQSTHPRGVRQTILFRGADEPIFQSTHPRGVRLNGLFFDSKGFQFQSTHPRGVRLWPTSSKLRDKLFQSTHPRGVRPAWCVWQDRIDLISIHAPAWGATYLFAAPLLSPDNFNPRTRVGCDLVSDNALYNIKISIHAPAWGATGKGTARWASEIISIHAPAWGATYSERTCRRRHRISIHAPAWGATPTGSVRSLCKAYFNPRTRVGCDDCNDSAADGCNDFNPRTRVGCDGFDRGD